MFIMHMPLDFKVGERALVKINDESTLLHWRDEHTLVIGDNDARRIVTMQIDGNLRCFICGDADGEVYDIDEVPGGGGFVVFKRQD
jgi:hypothetical protein